MSSVKFAAAIAAVLSMSAGAAQAGGRPVMNSEIVSAPSSILAMSIEVSEQAILNTVRPAPIASTRLASRHRPVSKPLRVRLAAMVLERRRANPVTSSFKFTAPIALGSEKALAAGDIRFVDRMLTSSISRPNSPDFCIGSIAPCGAVRFAQNLPVLTPSIWIRHYVSH
jgi:hypothetical protein